MAAAQIPNVHLEAMEEAPNEGSQLKEAGNPGREGVPVGAIPDWAIGESLEVQY